MGKHYQRKPTRHGHCEQCGEGFETTQPTRRFCSKRCASKGKWRKRDPEKQRRSHQRWEIRSEIAEGVVRYFRRCAHCRNRFRTKGRNRYCSAVCRKPPATSSDIAYASCLSCEGLHIVKPASKGKCPDCWWGTMFVRICRDCGLRVRRFGAQICDECKHTAEQNQRRQAKRRRRAQKKGRRHESYTVTQLIERDGADCWICAEPMELDWKGCGWQPRYRSVDHIIPLSRGGDDTPANAKLACWACNSERNDSVSFTQLRMTDQGVRGSKVATISAPN